jgi:hypothetical protein
VVEGEGDVVTGLDVQEYIPYAGVGPRSCVIDSSNSGGINLILSYSMSQCHHLNHRGIFPSSF